jgi:hypothetical protein
MALSLSLSHGNSHHSHHSLSLTFLFVLILLIILQISTSFSVVHARKTTTTTTSTTTTTTSSSSTHNSNHELISVIVVSRHGTRAPNLNTIDICPGDKENLERYPKLNISLEGVTGRGMAELYQLGTVTRERYIEQMNFLSEYFRNDELYIRAVGEDRTLQSAIAFGHGLYPPTTAPHLYPNSLPAPLPVYTLPDELDTLLENRKSGCRATLSQDVKKWDKKYLKDILKSKEYEDAIDQLNEICDVDLLKLMDDTDGNLGDAIKDITDMLSFDAIEEFPYAEHLDSDKLLHLRTLAVQILFGRLYNSSEQITYMNGDLPNTMLDEFDLNLEYFRNQSAPRSTEAKKMIAYHGHREMLYAIAAFFDIRYNISFPELPVGAIPPATTLFFELYADHSYSNIDEHPAKHDSVAEKHEEKIANTSFVRAMLWTPCGTEVLGDVSNGNHPNPEADASHSERIQEVACKPRRIRMHACSHIDCPFEEFKHIIKKQIKSTGPWEELCTASKDAKTKSQAASSDGDHSSVGSSWWLTALIVFAILGFMVYYCCFSQRRSSNHQYHTLP